MDQNFLGSLLHVESRINKCFLASQMLFVSQGFEFTEPVLGVAFLIALVKQFTLHNVLANFPGVIGTNVGEMDFLMVVKKDLDHFLQKMSISSEVEAIGKSLRCLAS